MIALLLNLLILCLIFGIGYWIITLLPLPPVPKQIALVVLAVLMLVILLGFVGWIPGYHIHYIR